MTKFLEILSFVTNMILSFISVYWYVMYKKEKNELIEKRKEFSEIIELIVEAFKIDIKNGIEHYMIINDLEKVDELEQILNKLSELKKVNQNK